ncbi:hypothetical protein CORC01_08836 [Colletotrichum orchidophilum]|uniref:CENP-T/Histone H4 histone fold domain-containing protein n=1 Tax=Colletotrichum orchidophilum TaxID=1209926 RepID=A0A1G4B339_9PEZI|nr:uncharacterized protein CORC01_08836 [Colletotrichum orchidophilum]OHE95839.1 hypothetical protein CORC01_08836 [Colletotrichum orchidophilum]
MSSSPTFTTPLNARLTAAAGADDDDPLFSSALDTVTPNRRALSLDPPSSRASLLPRTPSNNNPLRSSLRSSGYRGLSASGRRSLAATPHARAAYRTIDQRRAAALTPGGNKRRESFRPRRESLHDVLRGLSRVVKHTTQPISSSSSPSDVGSRAVTAPSASLPIRTIGDRRGTVYDDDDDDDELPIDRPRLSLPLDVEDDDEDELVAPELSQIDENATIEFPRRAYVDQPSRMSMGSARLSEYRNYEDLDDDDDRGEGFFPAFEVGALDEEGREPEETLDRVEDEDLRRETLASARDSDFGFEVPIDADNQTTFMMAVDGQSSPARPLPEITDEQPSLNIAPVDDEPAAPPMDEDLGFGNSYYDMRSSTPIEPTEAAEEELDGETEVSVVQVEQRLRKTKRGVKLSKYNVEYPSLPPAVVKRLANTFAKSSGISKTKISPDALAEIQRASDWFFEQLGDDLSAYAKHAKRKTIDESDMLTLMRRYVQRQTSSTTTPFSLAHRHLPRELLQELRMPKPLPPAEPKKKRRRVTDGGQ